MKPEAVIGALVLFVALPLGAFFVARAVSGTRQGRVLTLLAGVILFGAGTWGLIAGDRAGFFRGFGMTLFGLTAYLVVHLGAAGVIDRQLVRHHALTRRPLILRRAVSAGLIVVAYATVLLWPHLD